jgi:hypothetical protein
MSFQGRRVGLPGETSSEVSARFRSSSNSSVPVACAVGGDDPAVGSKQDDRRLAELKRPEEDSLKLRWGQVAPEDMDALCGWSGNTEGDDVDVDAAEVDVRADCHRPSGGGGEREPLPACVVVVVQRVRIEVVGDEAGPAFGLFALGVMSIGWMAVVGAFIAVEKMLPWKRLANRSVAVALAVMALAIALAPGAMGGMAV